MGIAKDEPWRPAKRGAAIRSRAGYQMDVTDPQWDSCPGMQKFRTFMAKYYPEADRSESGPLTAFNLSAALVEVLKRCGDNLTRDNVMKIVTNMDFEINTISWESASRPRRPISIRSNRCR